MGGCELDGQEGFLAGEKSVAADLGSQRGWSQDGHQKCEDMAAGGI